MKTLVSKPNNKMNTPISNSDLEIIADAKRIIETETLATQISRFVGEGVNIVTKHLPDSAQQQIVKSLNLTLTKATEWSWLTTGTQETPILRENWVHSTAVSLTGLIGGSLGLATALWEIPITTTIMLRNIGCIAEAEGLDMSQESTRLGCVSVLAMGGDPTKAKGEELGYWATRQTMAALVSESLMWSGRGVSPALVRFITATTARFGLVISEKTALQMVPFLGAGAGLAINNIFLDHYQNIAKAHFSLERLSLKYGEAAVKAAYESQEQ